MGHTLVIMNHHTELDWLFCWKVCERAGTLGNARAFAKDVLKYLPVIGWSSYMSEDIYLARSWEKDKAEVSKALEKLEGYPSPVWLHLFPEGTRKTDVKLKASQEFAASRDLPSLKNHLTPRTKGFSFTISETSKREGGFSSILDLTVVPDQSSDELTFKNIMCGKSTKTNIFLRKYDVKSIPTKEEESGEWLMNLFVEKDNLVQSYQESNTLDALTFTNDLSLKPHNLKPNLWTLALGLTINFSVISLISFVLFHASLFTWVISIVLTSVGLHAMKILFGAAEINNKEK